MNFNNGYSILSSVASQGEGLHHYTPRVGLAWALACPHPLGGLLFRCTRLVTASSCCLAAASAARDACVACTSRARAAHLLDRHCFRAHLLDRDADRPLVGRSDSDTTHDRCRSDSPFFRRKVATAELALDTHGTVTARRKWNRPGLHAPYVPTEYRLTFVSTPSARTKDRWTYR